MFSTSVLSPVSSPDFPILALLCHCVNLQVHRLDLSYLSSSAAEVSCHPEMWWMTSVIQYFTYKATRLEDAFLVIP